MTATARLAAAGLLLLVLTACGDDAPPPREAASPAPPVTASPTPTAEPTTPAPTEAPPTPTAPAPIPTEAPTTPPAEAAFPDAVAEPEQGGSYSAVFLTVTRAEDATTERDAAVVAAAEVGYTASIGDAACYQGAAEGLALEAGRDYTVAVLLFADASASQQFVDAYEPGVVGTADVQAYCLD